ncbi:hypothetical protein B8V81_1512 [Paenibacillus pasadenensis]|uniref:Uncharacterized protein n=1 Tax=Paenibacillus pasadenensis TaxID=217090 RepID=A0A2N5NAE8_9BACL|nr:hypothetical protein B8V81_1512 [Paenibacillus pasadenensis]
MRRSFAPAGHAVRLYYLYALRRPDMTGLDRGRVYAPKGGGYNGDWG